MALTLSRRSSAVVADLCCRPLVGRDGAGCEHPPSQPGRPSSTRRCARCTARSASSSAARARPSRQSSRPAAGSPTSCRSSAASPRRCRPTTSPRIARVPGVTAITLRPPDARAVGARHLPTTSRASTRRSTSGDNARQRRRQRPGRHRRADRHRRHARCRTSPARSCRSPPTRSACCSQPCVNFTGRADL